MPVFSDTNPETQTLPVLRSVLAISFVRVFFFVLKNLFSFHSANLQELQINSGINEEIELPILSELGTFPGFKGFTYKLKVGDGVERDITGDIKVNSNGLIIPGKDLISSGRYRIEVKGDSSQNPNVGTGPNYSGDYIYTFTVVGGPVPTTGVIVADTNKLPKTGEMVMMYVGIGLIIGGLGIYLTSKKMKAKKK